MSNAALMQDFCLLNCSMEQGCLHDECGTVDGTNHVVECFSTISHGTSFEKLAFEEADKKEWLTWIKYQHVKRLSDEEAANVDRRLFFKAPDKVHFSGDNPHNCPNEKTRSNHNHLHLHNHYPP